ncbi:hypothetical protein [Algoriphagus confluentis]|uniref:Lipoprotein n=1 Tax=Algoriphagus confluentis TaxID=1697556 RepID=A0ABQ6PUI6_9BACT|nr:hypothetical protein Aconfl_42590 [Algoriphagus confluentis]
MKNIVTQLLLFGFLASCSLLERKEYTYTFEKINENEIGVDFTKINPGPWDTLMFVAPYATAEQIDLGYSDSEYLAFHSGADFYIVVGFLEKGNLNGYTLATREADFDQLFNGSESTFVKKIPRSQAIFRFIKQEDGSYQLKN